jgi:quinohemoprotein ethanol dehydrogenase
MRQLARRGASSRPFFNGTLNSHRILHRWLRTSIAVALGATLLGGAANAQTKGTPDHIKAVTSAIDSAAITANTATSKDWPTYGLDYAETRFSKLNQITAENVKDIGLMWTYNLESIRGVEATPLVVDGIMYVSAPWSVVHAVDTRTGKRLWTFDPGVDREKGYRGCCDVVNRGVALYKGKVFVGAYDGRLVALDAATGTKVWEKDTVIDRKMSYTITGAPRVFNGKVVIGNGGAEYGVRGYVTAYDAETGNQAWRWFTVPGDPAKPFEDDSMAAAAKTWDPAGKYWVNGGGGSAWDTITFDPDLNMVYIGTGNGSPWNRNLRSPGGGDNLYLGSIVALNADTGKYLWHYQETPGDNWDYTSTQPMILADLTIDGAPRKVVLHAPKNGFFFVIDRTNGKFISAKNFVDVNWATGYDASGSPIEVPEARSPDKSFDSIPGPFGAHNWHPMSFNPQTGLVYLPAQGVPLNLTGEKALVQNAQGSNKFGGTTGWNVGFSLNAAPPKNPPFGRLIAWDPVKQKEAWRAEYIAPGMAARSRRPAISCSRAPPMAASSPITPRQARSSGRRRSAPAWWRRLRPMWSMACNTSRWRSGGAAYSASPSAPPIARRPARSTPSPLAARRRCQPLPSTRSAIC